MVAQAGGWNPGRQQRMAQAQEGVSRRQFLQMSGGTARALAVGIFAFPQGLELVEEVGPGMSRRAQRYERLRVANLSDHQNQIGVALCD